MPADTSPRDFPLLRLAPALEVKLDPVSASVGEVAGYASTFGGQPDAYGDVVAAGAFKRSLAEHRAAGTMPAMFWSHDPAALIGRWTDAREDAKGLLVRGRLNLETTRGQDAHSHVKHGDVSGLSFGYRVRNGGRTINGDGSALLTDVDLVEVSIVALPANKGARIMVKSIGSRRELEDLLHDELRLPKAAARKVAAGGWPALAGTDDEEQAKQIVAALKQSAAKLRG